MFEMDLTPEVLLRAYHAGIFPMASDRHGDIYWCQPEQRGVLDFENLKVSRSLRKVLQSDRFTVTSDRAFSDVIHACTERDETWISPAIENAYTALFVAGNAHSVEVWEDEKLVGGLYGVAIGGAFCGESMFHRATDASKVALVHLVRHLQRQGFVLLDCQYINPHLETLGATEIDRAVYERRLHAATQLPVSFGMLDPSLVLAAE